MLQNVAFHRGAFRGVSQTSTKTAGALFLEQQGMYRVLIPSVLEPFDVNRIVGTERDAMTIRQIFGGHT